MHKISLTYICTYTYTRAEQQDSPQLQDTYTHTYTYTYTYTRAEQQDSAQLQELANEQLELQVC